ncbi:hypothetical protein QTP88_022589 [Uroleucon formosanum]
MIENEQYQVTVNKQHDPVHALLNWSSKTAREIKRISLNRILLVRTDYSTRLRWKSTGTTTKAPTDLFQRDGAAFMCAPHKGRWLVEPQKPNYACNNSIKLPSILFPHAFAGRV